VVAKSGLLKVGVKSKIFVNGGGDFQTGLVKVGLLLVFQSVLAYAVGGAIPRFLGYVIEKYSVDFEDRFDTIQVTFFVERPCVKALAALFSTTKD